MQNTVRDTIIEHNILKKGDRCIIAVSGGADSTGLMHALIRLNNVFKVSYRVVHVHHGIRGVEADRDANFVKSCCAAYNIPCRIIKVDVPAFAEKHKVSTEEAARYLRYQALETEAQRWEMEDDTQKMVKIAVAHNKEDNAETILMQLARGSGLKGIAGMNYVRGRIVRPLLDVSREEIEKYLIKEEETWINDSTNDEDDYTRNKIRHSIMPSIVSEINAGAVDNITRAGKLVGMADSYLTKVAEKELEGCIQTIRNGYCIPAEMLLKQDPIIKAYIIRALLGRVNKSMKNITSRHIEDIISLEDAETGKRIDLPYRMEAVRDYETIKVFRRECGSSGEEELPDPGKFVLRTFPYKGEKPPEGKYTKWFDYDKIYDLIEVRTRKSGDYIHLGNVGKKSLRTYMTDAKIPQEMRDSINVISIGNDVVWLVGYRIGETFKVDNTTEIVLEIKYEEGE